MMYLKNDNKYFESKEKETTGERFVALVDLVDGLSGAFLANKGDTLERANSLYMLHAFFNDNGQVGMIVESEETIKRVKKEFQPFDETLKSNNGELS